MTIKVCIGSACHIKGSYDIINTFDRLIKENNLNDKLDINASFCLDHCQGAVSVQFDEKVYSVQPENAEQFFNTVVREKVC